MVRVSSAKLRPWSELTAKMVMGVVPGLLIFSPPSKNAVSRRDTLEDRNLLKTGV